MTALPGVTFIAPEDVSAETSLTRTDEITAIPHEKLHDHPANPAGRVEMHAIAELLQSIDRFGQREPVRVRDAGPIGHYQILSGHRRVAACRMLGRDVRGEVVDCSDEEALREVILGNADRKDLDPIERAELLQQMIDAGMDREQAGALFGLESESGVKNTLRLLKLPECVRSMVREGLMPVRIARQFVPYAAAETLLAAEMEKLREDTWDLQSLREGDMTIDADWFGHNGRYRPMTGEYYPGWPHERAERGFEPTKAQRKKLDIVEAPLGKNGAIIEIAQNVKLFDKLNEPFVVKANGYGGASPAAKAKKKAEPKPELTPAELKAKHAEQDKQLKNKLQVWRRRWIRCLLATEVPPMDPLILTTLVWWLEKQYSNCYVDAALDSLGMKVKRTRGYNYTMMARDPHQWLGVMIGMGDAVDDNTPPGYALLDRVWRVLVWPQVFDWPVGEIAGVIANDRLPPEPPKRLVYDPSTIACDPELDAMVAAAKIDPAAAWTAVAKNPHVDMITEYLGLHNVRQLRSLAKSARVEVAEKATKGQLLDELSRCHFTDRLPVPAVLKPKPKRRARGKRAK